MSEIIVHATGQPKATNTTDIEYLFRDEAVEISINTKPWIKGEDLDTLTLHLHQYMNVVSVGSCLTYLRLHAACVSLAGRTAIICGEKGAGKTTLALQLMLGGCKVHCDEMVLFDADKIWPFPRKFYLKNGTLELLPDFNKKVKRLRQYDMAENKKCRMVDPTSFGYEWDVTPRHPSHIYYLAKGEQGYRNAPAIESTLKYVMVQHLMEQTLNFDCGIGQVLNHLTALTTRCACHTITSGKLGTMTELVLDSLTS